MSDSRRGLLKFASNERNLFGNSHSNIVKHTNNWVVKQRKENQVRTNHRQEILERDGNACVRCGVSASDGEAELIIHHIVPVSEGGSAEPENLATLCSGCHSSAHDEYGSGEVFYSTNTGFWQWVREGDRGFDPHHTQQNLDAF